MPDVLYVDEGNLLTAAGSAAGIDLSLHLIRRDWGTAAANSVARRLVVPPHRDGGQAQFIEAPVPEAREGGRLGPAAGAHARRARPRDEHRRRWRETAGMSRRTFLRRFKADTGTTPGAWLARRARWRGRAQLLETTRLRASMTWRRQPASATAANLRHHFRKELKVSPSDFRRRFGSPAA